MKPTFPDLPAVYLKPGEVYFSDKPTLVTTVLGSCIAVTMFYHRLNLGAICHGLLPKGSCTDGFKYVDCSIREMVQRYDTYGINRSEIEVKLFGGSDMFDISERRDGCLTVGNQNVSMAIQVVEKEHLRLLTSDIGGSQGRKIHFKTHTGEVFLKRLRKAEAKDLS